MSRFKFVELFAGIGGFRQGLTPLGGECVLASEWDKHAQQSYGILYGTDHLHGDVTKIDENDVPDHDVLVFGMPCQAFSVAGKRLGFEDMRGTLYFEAMRIARAKKPKVLWMENVKGLVGHDGGRTLDVMAQAMSDIGYTIDFEVINSKYFGVPQNRERIFMIGVRNDLVEPTEWNVGKRSDVVAKGKRRIAQLDVRTFNFDWPAQEEVTVRLRDILESDVDERYYLSEEKTAKLVAQLEEKRPDDVRATLTPDREEKRQNGRRFKDTDEPAFTLNTQDRHGVTISEPKIEQYTQGDGISLAIAATYAKGLSPGRIKSTHTHVIEEGVYKAQSEALELAKEFMRGDDNLSVKIHPNLDLRPHRNDERKSGVRSLTIVNHEKNVSNTVTSAHEPKIYGESTRYRIRKLTPRECFRLQGFADSEFDKLTANGISNSQLYKQAGNAVTVNVISAIGKRLLPYI